MTPLQNRVSPTGDITSDPARGTLMGNRGCLHGSDRTLGSSRWRSTHWICCTLSWKGVQRDPMPPGRWTALFFLDEATALAAGHRPCAYCRRDAFVAFAEAWRRATGASSPPRAPEIDARLHTERVDPRSRRQVTREARVATLPEGVMVRHQSVVGTVSGASMLPWSFAGYGVPVPLEPGATVELLTPPATVAAIDAGYRASMHPSAGASLREHPTPASG